MDRHRVVPGAPLDLSSLDPNDSPGFAGGKSEGRAHLKALRDRLSSLQELMYAEGKHKILMVLQAMDTGGKDGAIRHVFRGTNPQGVKVASFKAPSKEELAHDYLWRIHDHAPATGHITIFNRSHYEDVLIVRVKNFVDEATWRKRYQHIREFERMLADEGTTILKFFLHIDLAEQKERLQARLDEPDKTWKFNIGDLAERKLWPDYMAAYEEAMAETSTDWAPWFVVPANKKWYRNVVISTVLINALEGLDMQYPEPEEGLDEVVIP